MAPSSCLGNAKPLGLAPGPPLDLALWLSSFFLHSPQIKSFALPLSVFHKAFLTFPFSLEVKIIPSSITSVPVWARSTLNIGAFFIIMITDIH